MVQLWLRVRKPDFVPSYLPSATGLSLDFLCRRHAKKGEILQLIRMGESDRVVPDRILRTTQGNISSCTKSLYKWQRPGRNVAYRRARWADDHGLGTAEAR